MKCDELKIYVMPLKTNIFGKTTVGQAYYPKSDVDAAIAELKQKLEDAKATAYADSVDAGMRERKLKRELWIARALALSRFDVDDYLRKYTHCNSRYWNDRLNSFNEACKEMQKAINIAEAKCRAKAEEYK